MDEVPTKILEYLLECDEEVPTLQISKYVFGDKATKKMVNKYLYALEKEGSVVKSSEENGTKPKWRVTKND